MRAHIYDETTRRKGTHMMIAQRESKLTFNMSMKQLITLTTPFYHTKRKGR